MYGMEHIITLLVAMCKVSATAHRAVEALSVLMKDLTFPYTVRLVLLVLSYALDVISGSRPELRTTVCKVAHSNFGRAVLGPIFLPLRWVLNRSATR